MFYIAVIFAHVIGDYIIQTDWMANEKTNRWLPAIIHGITYTIPYMLITQNIWALLIIGGTHIVLDHYRVAKYVVWIKNFMSPRKYWYSWAEAKENNGFPAKTPAHISFWIMVIVDNTIHLAINFAAILLL